MSNFESQVVLIFFKVIWLHEFKLGAQHN